MRVQGKGTIACGIIVITSLLTASCGNKRPAGMSISPAVAVPVTRTLQPLPVRPLSPSLIEMRARTMHVASDLRGLAWTGEVGMAELSGWEYGTRTREMAEVLGGDELQSLSKLAAAGGLFPEGTDLLTLAASFTAVSAGATYSPLDRQILLVDKFKGGSLLTHEFVHALQDQNFDLLKLLVVRPYNFDRTEAVFAVIEGDAMNVQRRAEEGDAYARKSLDDITRQENGRFSEYRKEIGSLFPPLLSETFIFRYRDGARFIEAVRRRSGERGVDELFRHPPVSSKQVLHPDKYEAPRDVHVDENAFAARGWRLVTSTPLGEIGVRGLLMAGVSERDAIRVAAGWGGDCAYLFERQGGAPLFVWKTVWEKPPDAQEFYKAYNLLERARKSAPVEDGYASGNEAQAVWREGGRTTLIRREGDSVIIIRGAEADTQAMLEAARR